jgi:prevent-host-death family protein
MAQLISVSEARTHFYQIIARAARGEEFIITKRGKPVARIVPYREPEAAQKEGGKHGATHRGV